MKTIRMTQVKQVTINVKRGCSGVIVALFAALMLLCTLRAEAAARADGMLQQSGNEQEQTVVSYYGRLSLPPTFVNHPEFNNPLWRVQGGEVMLTSAQHIFRVPTEMDGTFVVYNLPYGTYHLHAEYAQFIYPTVRVDVTQKTAQGISRAVIRTYMNDGSMVPVQGTGLDESSPAIIPFADVHVYYVPREQYNVWDFFKNPIILMMVLSMGMVGLMRLLPEEERKESVRELQRLRKQLGGDAPDDAKRPSLEAAGKTGGVRGEKKSK